MITLTTEQAQQIEEVLSGMLHGTAWNNGTHAKIYRPKFPEALATIRAARAQGQAEQGPVGYWQGKFSQDGGAVLYEVPQASAFGYHYPNYPVYAAPQPVKQEPVNICKPEHLSCPVCGYYCLGKGGMGCIDKPTLCALNETTVQKAEPVAWMWACAECGTEAEDGTDGRICSSCGYHKFYKAPKVATYVCEAASHEQAEQEPVAWSDDITVMPFNTYCKAIVNWRSYSTCGESYLEGNEAEVIVVKYGMTEGSAYTEPKPRFVFLHTGTNQYRDTSVHVLKWKLLYAAAPVRTKDLTDYEIHKCMNGNFYNALDFARAVIAADRELNK